MSLNSIFATNHTTISNSHLTEVLIIGAGPSGSVAAAELRRQGIDVIVVEKTQFPRFVIGESLLPRCMDILDKVGLIDTVKEAGFQKKFGAKFISSEGVCDFNFSEQYTEGWTWTWQVPRADFDKVLADKVVEMDVKVLYETEVVAIEFGEEGVNTKLVERGSELTIQSKYVIDGSGYGRVLPRLLDLSEPSDQPPRSAHFTHFIEGDRPKNEDENRIQVVVLNQNLWVWVIPFSNGRTSLGFVGDLADHDFESLLNQNEILKNRFGDCEHVFEPKKIEAFAISVKQFYGDRFVLTGNSTEFLDPIFSSGVTFALESAYLAAGLVAKELRGEKANWEMDYVEHIQKGVDVFRSYVNYWYDGTLQSIFFADEIKQTIKDQICSVLAGYVWDDTNPYVKKHASAPSALAKVIRYNY